MVLCVLPTGCALAFDFGGFAAAPSSIDAGAASDAPTESMVSRRLATVTLYGTYRAWSDGTYAASCSAYLHPLSAAYAYDGATGSGVYAVKPIRAESPLLVLCEMTATGEGWTLITTSSSEDRPKGGATTQTLGCVTSKSYCNVAGEPWDYEFLRQTWSDCAGAEARISKAAFQDDTNACNNQVDSLLFTFNSPLFVGMKAWNDCSFECVGKSWFAGQRLPSAVPTLVTDAKFVTSTAGGFVLMPGGEKCGGDSYGCESGYDNIWLR